MHPISSIPSGDDHVGCKIDVNDRGVELRFDRDDVVLCPGCFLVGGQNNVVVSFSYDDDRDFSDTTISEARAFCTGFPRGDAPVDGDVRSCAEEENAEYEGSKLLTGGLFLVPSPEACCLACRENPDCNVWTFCTAEDGCGRSEFAYTYSACEMKYASPEIISQDVVPGVRGPEVTYISGALRDKQIDAVPFDTSNERKECRAKTEAN